MENRSKLQYVLLGLASALTLVMAFAKGRTLVVLGIALLSILALSMESLIRRWRTQEAIRSAWASLILAAGTIFSYKLQHSGALLLVPGAASAIFAIFAVRELRSQKATQAQRVGGAR
jgi:hypothetical protein